QQKARVLEQEAKAAGLVSNPAAVAKIKNDIGMVAAPAVAAKPVPQAGPQALSYVAEEQKRLAVLEQQLKVLMTQQDLKKADVDVVQKEIGAEQARLSLLEKQSKLLALQAQEAAKVADLRAVAQIKSQIGFQTPVMPTKIGGQFGAAPEAVLQQTAEEQKKLSLLESQLKVLREQDTFRKVDLEEVQKEITQEKTKLTVLERQATLLIQQARQAAQVTDQAAIANIKKAVGYEAPTPPPKVGGLFGASPAQAAEHVAEERQKLALMEAQLKVLQSQDKFRKVDLAEVQKKIIAEKSKLAVL